MNNIKLIKHKPVISKKPYFMAIRVISLGLVIVGLFASVIGQYAYSEAVFVEPVTACVIPRKLPLDNSLRKRIADCLGWEANPKACLCFGSYKPMEITPLQSNEIQIKANRSSLYLEGRSALKGGVEVRESSRIVTAETAYIYRDAQSKEISRIELIDEVHYIEPGRLMIAKRAVIHPQDHSGFIEDVLYRFNTQRSAAILPAWGRANLIKRFANRNLLLRQTTYSTCSPRDIAWQVDASEITIDDAKETGVARNALIRVRNLPILYTPYLSFPTTKKRKSGFLMPYYGYSNVTGFDYAFPYYLNIAPNFDATLVPHVYTLRGFMMGGNARFLTEHSSGMFGGNFLPKDRAYSHFLDEHQDAFPVLQGDTNNRWSVVIRENTHFSDQLKMNIDYQQVSDDYYLQDFSTNLAVATQNQLLRQGDLNYTTDHWLLRGLVQSYQTLHPINQSAVANIYERLPELSAAGSYADLPLNATFNVLGQFDYFHWTDRTFTQPEGPRYHLNPILALPQMKPWGYITPAIQLVENNYELSTTVPMGIGAQHLSQSFNRAIPRYSFDGGLTFERRTAVHDQILTQTLEPRLYYLRVPYQNQSQFPAFDSAYMIFNTDQLFRDNRFSGFDRIGDANQLAYAATSRWISETSGREIASVTVGQIRYFSERQVQLCYNHEGDCVDSPLFLGYVSPLATYSPIASKASYALSTHWLASADYVWDPFTNATNNGNLNLHYQPTPDRILRFGYNYIVSGNVIDEPVVGVQDSALHQATVSYGWPLTDNFSSLGVYSYNISKRYDMMTFFGLQYDSCCWAFRLLGGRTFNSLSIDSTTPQYNNNVYFQVLLKGLGAAANNDPATTIQAYLPGYPNLFSH